MFFDQGSNSINRFGAMLLRIKCFDQLPYLGTVSVRHIWMHKRSRCFYIFKQSFEF